MVKKKTGGKATHRATARGDVKSRVRVVKAYDASGKLKGQRTVETGRFLKSSDVKRSSRPVTETVTLPRRDYEALVEAAEDRKALRAYEATRDEESFPAKVVNAILDGGNPIRVWREYRGLRQNDLARDIGVSKSHLSDVENGRSNLSVPVLSALADALEVDMEMLVPRSA